MAAFIFVLLLATPTFQGFVIAKDDIQDISFIVSTTVTYSNPSNGTNFWSFTEDDRSVGLFMNDTWQTVQLINYSHPVESIKHDADGNLIAILRFSKTELGPGENLSFNVVYQVISKPRLFPTIREDESQSLGDIPEDLREEYGKGVDPWRTYGTELQELAHSVAGNETKVLTIVEGFIAWINGHIKYPKFSHETPLYPEETYGLREGDCDDQAILLITLCRIYDIPAYLQIGCIYLPETEMNETYFDGHLTSISENIGWHGWAMVYIPPWGWLPVDLTYVDVGIGGIKEPIDAIKRGAVTLQKTIRYLNVVKSDYVASSREDREFLQENGFYVYMRDEMTLEPLPERSTEENGFEEKSFQRFLIAIVIVTTVITVTIICLQKGREKGVARDRSPFLNEEEYDQEARCEGLVGIGTFWAHP